MQDLDDGGLLGLYAKKQSEEAFASLVRRHLNLVYSVALRDSGNAQEAEEISQAVFLILARKAGRLGGVKSLGGWLFQVTRLTAKNFARSEMRRQRREQEAYMQANAGGPSTDVWPRIAPLLDEAVGELAEADRRAIVARFYEGRNLREVGKVLGASEDAAEKRVSRALEKLRGIFARRGVISTATIIAGAISANSVQAAPAGLRGAVTAAALAQGAGGATLTLAKGVLKIMAWTKAKMAAVVAVVAVVVIAGAVTTAVVVRETHAARVAAYPNIEGAWEGVVKLDDAGVNAGESGSVHVVLKLVKTANGYEATSDWIERGRKGVPMGKVDYDFPALRLGRVGRDVWDLRVNADATAMIFDHTIHFIQPDTVVFQRTTTPEVVPERLAEADFAPRRGSDLQGYWKGLIGTGVDARPVNLKIAEQMDGTFRAEGDNPTQGESGLTVEVSYNRPAVELALASGAGKFQGAINPARTEITGTFLQDGQASPAKLTRGDYAAEHALDAQKDYSYASPNDLAGHWQGAWVVTIGTTTTTIRMALDVAKLPNGTYAPAMRNVDELGHDDPIAPSEFEYEAPKLSMKWQRGCAYEGTLKDGKIEGTWMQGGAGFAMVMERVK